MLGNVRQAKADFRRDDRFPVNYYAAGDHGRLGRLVVKIVDLSSTGVMIDGKAGIERGDKILLHLSDAIKVEALCIWTWHQHAGLQFDQAMSSSDLISTMQTIMPDKFDGE
ncbi:PilZ domain-containing protein [Sphingorhabdus sp.]|uniref:PilZ domain-containing protein n=1 Tax=Sphingorhabdus sp. TaxID=1902408 RepID=UPI00391A9BB3